MSDALVTIWDTDSSEGVAAFPDDTAYFLDYDDGNPISQVILARFPKAVGLTITTVPGDNNFAARMCDSEASGFTPEQAAYWAHMKLTTRGERPTIYVEISQKPLVAEALATYGLEFGTNVDCFYAWWDGDPNVRQGIYDGVGCGTGNVGHQYVNDGQLYDTSVAYEQWVTGPWPPPPAPVPKEGETMLIAVPKALVKNCQDDWVLNGAAYFNLWDEAQDGQVTTYAKGFTGKDADKLVKAGFPVADDSDGGLLNRAAGHVVTAA